MGVAGVGLIGQRHLAAVMSNQRCRLDAVIDPNPEVAVPLGVPHFTALSDVDVGLDAVIIATPTHLHLQHGLLAVARGWHVLVEKPVTSDLAAARLLARAVCRAPGVHALVGHHRRHHPRVLRLHQLLNEGVIGTPIAANLLWAVRKPDAYFVSWRVQHGGPVRINLVHDIDMLRFLFGNVIDIRALPGCPRRARDRIESGSLIMRFATGTTAAISFSDASPSPWGFEAATGENPNIAATKQDMMWIIGSDGAISFPSLTRWGGATDWSQAPTAQDMSQVGGRYGSEAAPLQAQLNHFCDVVAGKAEPVSSVEDAVQTLQATLQVERSMGQGMQPDAAAGLPTAGSGSARFGHSSKLERRVQ